MMKITFINPPQTNSKYKFLGVVAPSLGIGYMAAVLEKNGYDVDVMDASALAGMLTQGLQTLLPAQTAKQLGGHAKYHRQHHHAPVHIVKKHVVDAAEVKTTVHPP